jgi:uncharacterized protein YkvS
LRRIGVGLRCVGTGAGIEFVDGVAKGVEKTFQNKVVLSNQLQNDNYE